MTLISKDEIPEDRQIDDSCSFHSKVIMLE